MTAVDISPWADNFSELNEDALSGVLLGFTTTIVSILEDGATLRGVEPFLVAVMGVARRGEVAGGRALDLVTVFVPMASQGRLDWLVSNGLFNICLRTEHAAASVGCIQALYVQSEDITMLQECAADAMFLGRIVEIVAEDSSVCCFVADLVWCALVPAALFHRNKDLVVGLIDAVLARSDVHALSALEGFARDRRLAEPLLSFPNFIDAVTGALDTDKAVLISSICKRLCVYDRTRATVIADPRIIEALSTQIRRRTVRENLFYICNCDTHASSNLLLHSLCSRSCDCQVTLARALI
ncbi:hypothetical protein TeGR_g8351, partial [Tetraparma gracilis]